MFLLVTWNLNREIWYNGNKNIVIFLFGCDIIFIILVCDIVFIIMACVCFLRCLCHFSLSSRSCNIPRNHRTIRNYMLASIIKNTYSEICSLQFIGTTISLMLIITMTWLIIHNWLNWSDDCFICQKVKLKSNVTRRKSKTSSFSCFYWVS